MAKVQPSAEAQGLKKKSVRRIQEGFVVAVHVVLIFIFKPLCQQFYRR